MNAIKLLIWVINRRHFLGIAVVVLVLSGIQPLFTTKYAQAEFTNHRPALQESEGAFQDVLSPGNTVVYMPLVISQPSQVTLLGVYVPGYAGFQQTIDSELVNLDTWAGKHHTIVGLFIDFKNSNPDYDIPTQLESLRKNGYTAFINFQANNTMRQIARGDIDAYIRATARAYANWASQDEDRMAFIAPFTEMNGDWTTYGEDPVNFKIGFKRVQDLFAQEGVPDYSVRWVFGPNGWSEIPFESFYPGDDRVDINALSSYNYGYCDAIDPWKWWRSPEEVYEVYVDRMKAMAPTKPIFIAQTATTAMNSGGYDETAKNQWLTNAYNYLTADPYVRGIIYVNLHLECDWPIYNSSGLRFGGYREAASNSKIIYLSPSEITHYNWVVQP